MLNKEAIVDFCIKLLIYPIHRVMHVCLRGIEMNQT
jgi:hypothetical protein